MKTLKNIVASWLTKHKLVTFASLLGGLLLWASLTTQPARADGGGGTQMQFKFQSFLGTYENLCLSNNTTVSNGQYGLQVLGVVGQYWSNVVCLSTNTNSAASNIFANAFTDVKLYPDANGNVSTNNAIVLVINNTNVVLLDNQNVIQTNVATNCVVLTAAATNTVTVTIQKIPYNNGLAWTSTGVLSADTWSFTTPALPVGTLSYVFTTNAPSWMYYGAKGFHITTVASSSSTSSPGVLISQLGFVAWAW